MTGPVQNATNDADLLDALIMRVATAFDKTKSSRELVSLSGELMKLLRQREDLKRAAANADAEAAADAAREAALEAARAAAAAERIDWLAELG